MNGRHRCYYRGIAVLAWRLKGQTGDNLDMCEARSVIDLTGKLGRDGVLTWQVPAGRWVVIHFGHFVGQRARTKNTGGAPCLEIDRLRADVMDRHFAATVGTAYGEIMLPSIKAFGSEDLKLAKKRTSATTHRYGILSIIGSTSDALDLQVIDVKRGVDRRRAHETEPMQLAEFLARHR